MGPHESFEFEWSGKKHAIKPEDQTKLIAAIEEHLTAVELAGFVQKHGSPPTAKLAMAWGILLRYVGEKVTDNEVRYRLFGQSATAEATIATMLSLLNFMGALGEMSEEEKLSRPLSSESATAANSLKKFTKRRSGRRG